LGAKSEEVTGESRKLHKEERNELYALPTTIQGDQIKQREMGRECGMYGERRDAYRL